MNSTKIQPDLPTFPECVADPRFARDPFPAFARLREHDPVQWSESLQSWVISGYEETRAALQDFVHFSNQGRVTGLFESLFDAAQQRQLAPIVSHYSSGLINVDPPDHTRLRKILHVAFKPSMIAALQDRVEGYVDALLDAMECTGQRDFIAGLSLPLPVKVISELLGIPQSDVDRVIDWSHRIVSFQQYAAPDFVTVMASQDALLELRDYLQCMIEVKRRAPADDALSLMAMAAVEEGRLTDEEIVGTAVTMINGGHETTTRFLANALVALHAFPDERARLLSSPELMDPAVEELLRFVGPFQRDGRVCKEAAELGGRAIKAGDYLVLLLGAANRDPRHYSAPEELVLDRRPNKHLAFGFGPHICLGAPLARLESAIALRRFLTRYPRYQVDADSVAWEFGFVWGPRRLPFTRE